MKLSDFPVEKICAWGEKVNTGREGEEGSGRTFWPNDSSKNAGSISFLKLNFSTQSSCAATPSSSLSSPYGRSSILRRLPHLSSLVASSSAGFNATKNSS